MDLPGLLSDDKGTRSRWLAEGDAGAALAALAAGCSAAGGGRTGAVAAGSPHATDIGMGILRAGGNAADAAAASAFAMMVADPPNASPAGRGHVIWAGPDGPVRAIDGATRAPSSLPEGTGRLPENQAIPLPGIVRALLKFHAEAGHLSLAEVAAPARDLARDGFAVPAELAQVWLWRAPELKDPDARSFYLPGGKAPEAGETFRNPGLADFLDRVIGTGHDPFSDPGYAEPFCDRLAAKGAFWTVDDLQAAEPLEGETVSHDGDGWRLASIGRQGWGHTLLRIVALSAAAGADGPLEAETAHLLAILRAFGERPAELRSFKPKTEPPSWDELGKRMGGPPPEDWNASEFPVGAAGLPRTSGGGDTTHISAVDAAGMRVALTLTIGPHFGCRVADPETGILLAHSFHMAEAPTPGARDVTEPCPSLLDAGDAAYALGAAGSERIPGAVAAVVRHLLEGADLGRAMAAPRSNWIGAVARLHLDVPEGLEERLSAAGVEVAFTGRGPVDHLGIVQAVGRTWGGKVLAAADPAYSGKAVAE